MGTKRIDGADYRTYGYRWVVLGAFMAVNLAIQVLWISYAPITGDAAAYYGVSDLAVGLFAMVFMIAFIPLSIPVSWSIDALGFVKTVGFGSVLMAAAAILRGAAGDDYRLALAGSIGVAAAQPFLLNAWTKVPALWFAPGERATAVGLVTLSNLAGTAIGMVLTPILSESMGIARVQLAYGAFAASTAAFFIAAARERPPSPPSEDAGRERALMLDGLKNALSLPAFRRMLAIAFICLGAFNGVTTWIEAIIRPRGYGPVEAGTLGAVMLVSGVVGAVILPALSDKAGRRKPFILLGAALAIPGLAGLAVATGFAALCIFAGVFGFFLTSVLPTGMQYASEIALPTPEGTSNGLVQLFGQASVVFVYMMEALRSPDGSFTVPLLAACGALVAGAILAATLDESGRKAPMPRTEAPRT